MGAGCQWSQPRAQRVEPSFPRPRRRHGLERPMASDLISHDYVVKLLETGASGGRYPPHTSPVHLSTWLTACPACPLSPSSQIPPWVKLPRSHQGPCSVSLHHGRCPLSVTGTGVCVGPGRVCVLLTGPHRCPGTLQCRGYFWDILGPRALMRLCVAVVQGVPGICDRELPPSHLGRTKTTPQPQHCDTAKILEESRKI